MLFSRSRSTTTIQIIGFGFILSLFFFFTGWYGHILLSDTQSDNNSIFRQEGYEFISPLLECNSKLIPPKFFNQLKNNLSSAVESEKNKGNASKISLYYRDLSNGPWFGIDENEKFFSASLLKVPIMMALFKYSENVNPSYLDKKILYKGIESEISSYFFSKETLVLNNEYKISDLMEKMIINSDNKAKDLILTDLDMSFYNKVYEDLGIENPFFNQNDNKISAREISSFFRILYNSTYLSNYNSEKSLKILSKTNFDKGLKRGIGNTKIAHKFGERSYIGSVITKQLHDCGIIYIPNKPYILCIMTEGNDFNKLSDSIANISEIAYKEIINY
jgi:beta-lactamase class A